MAETEPVCALVIARRIVAEKRVFPDSGEPDTREGVVVAALFCEKSGMPCQVVADMMDGKFKGLRVVTQGECEEDKDS